MCRIGLVLVAFRGVYDICRDNIKIPRERFEEDKLIGLIEGLIVRDDLTREGQAGSFATVMQ